MDVGMMKTEALRAPGSSRALGLALLAHIASAICGFGVAPLAPFFQPELHLSTTQVGLMMSLYYVGAIAGSLPAGYLSDRLPARIVMAGGNIVMGFFIFLVGTVPGYWPALLLMLMAGLGFSVINPITAKVVMAWFESRRRGTAMSIKQMGATLGGMLGAGALPGIASVYNWHVALQVAGIFSIVSGVGIFLAYREADRIDDLPRARVFDSFRGVLTDRPILLIGVVSGLFAMAQMSVVGYLVLFLNHEHSVSVVTAGIVLAIAQAAGTVGRIGWGYASDVYFRGDRRKALLWIGVVVLLASSVTAIVPSGASLWLLVPLSAVFGASALGWNGVILAMSGEVSRSDRVGLSTALNAVLTFLGSMTWPPIFGIIVDNTGSFSYAWGATSIVVFGGLLLLLFVVKGAAAQQKVVPTNG